MINGKRVVGLCTTKLYAQTNFDFLQAVHKELKAIGMYLFVYHCCTDFYEDIPEERGESRIYDMLHFELLDALIVCEENFSIREIAYDIIEEAGKHKIPTLVIGEPHPGALSFKYDYTKGFELVVRHMIEVHKPKRPHFMGGMPDNAYSLERENIFIKVLEENGYTFDKSSMVSYGRFWDGSARQTMKEMIEKGQEMPDSIICANDSMAIGVCASLKEAGYRVPEDIKVSGFDGIENVYYSNPQITSVFCNADAMAHKIVEGMVSLLEDNKDKFDELTFIEPELLLLESCGCNKSVEVNGVEIINYKDNYLVSYIDRDRRIIVAINRIQNSENLEEINQCLRRGWMRHISVMLCPEVMDETVAAIEDYVNVVPDEFLCIFSEENDKYGPIKKISRADIVPDLDMLLERNVPIVFNSIHINNTLIGYICHHSDYIAKDQFLLLSQLTTLLKIGLVGYQKKQHQKLISDNMVEIYKSDELTGFYQRRVLNFEIQILIDELKTNRRKVAVLLADLDKLKYINDQFGHEEGDRAIVVLSRALRASTPADAILVRFGGDELLAVFKTEEDIKTTHDSIYAYLDKYNNEENPPCPVSASIGIVEDDRFSFRSINKDIRNADRLMYEEKKKKKALRK